MDKNLKKEEALNLLWTIINSHGFRKMTEWNENGEFIADAKVAVEVIREQMSLLNDKFKDLPGLSYNISLILHATNMIDKMIKGLRDYNKKDLVIYHYFIEDTVKKMIDDPEYWQIK